MNLAPIYELRSRLRTAMIAGTNLLSEDFRLKRAAQDLKPMEALSPVFAKIGQLTDSLLDERTENKEGVLLDTITLVDALLCTQGQVAVEGELKPVAGNDWGSVITNAPYSVVKTLVEALTTSGNGHYQYVLDTHEASPELFQDYRIKSALVAALGAAYAELAETVMEWLKQEGTEILPLLQKGFDPKGKKEMVRRVQVMEAVAGSKCNDFYVQMLSEAEKDVKNALIYALRHSEENIELLLEFTKKEKGNAKKMAYYALASMEDERCELLFREMYEKKPADAMILLRMTNTGWACEMTGRCLIKQLERCKEPGYGKGEQVYEPNETETLRMHMEALPGKTGAEICEAFRTLYEADDIYYQGYNKNGEKAELRTWEMHVPVRRLFVKTERIRLSKVTPYLLESSIRMTADDGLCALAQELYEKKSANNKGQAYFIAAFTAKLLGKEDCTQWLKEQLFTKTLFGVKKNTSVSPLLARSLKGLEYDNEKGYILHTYMKDEANETIMSYEFPVTQDIAGKLTDLLIDYSEVEVDREMINLINPENRELCRKLEKYFSQRVKAGVTQDCRTYWAALNKCGCEDCEGLLQGYLKTNSSERGINSWELYSRLWDMPGSAESFEKEAEVVYKQICEGKIKVQNWREETFLKYVENVKARKRGL